MNMLGGRQREEGTKEWPGEMKKEGDAIEKRKWTVAEKKIKGTLLTLGDPRSKKQEKTREGR